MNTNSIKKRKQSILKLIASLEEKNIIEDLLIEEEYKSIKLLQCEKSISEINCNIKKSDINISKVKTKKIKDTIIGTNKSKVDKSNVFELTEEERLEYLKYRNKVSDTNYFNKIKEKLDKIPESNGCRYYDKIKVNIGIVADEFLMNSYEGVANFIYITPENYKDYIGKLDLFLVVTAWKGLNGEWKTLGNPKIRKVRNQLFNIIKEYKAAGTITAFYSKEDPVNYDIFKEISIKCEYIFTTCEEIVDEYKKYCNNENVHVLKFGVNPTYHNPIGFRKFNKEDKVIFSGSWYKKYKHRIKDMEMLFNGVIDSKLDLKIIDRNYDLKLQQYFFPEKYLSYVSPAIAHEYLQKTHKLFNWAINFNSIKDSNTMFANRIYELQALGNILISNYSVGVNNLFPNVFIVNDRKEVSEIINTFTDEEVYEHQVFGIRSVMSNETSYSRIEYLLDKVGISHKLKERSVLVVADQLNDKVNEMFNRQSYKYKQIIEKSKFKEEIKSNYDIIAFFSSTKEYGRYYLEDMINAFKYTNSRFITKDGYYKGDSLVEGIEHDYIDTMKDKYKTVFWANEFKANELLNFEGEVKLNNGYSIDRFEFNDDAVISIEENKKDYKFSVIIATYNNGKHLINKCFNSLRRSSMFNEMEVIIVDDGSTDNETQEIVKYLERNYSNVKTFLFNDGGSGTASRPRNTGVEISTTDYITFLDPDNEAVNDGYAKLYKELTTNNVDMVVGNMLKVDKTNVSKFDYYKTVLAYNSDKTDTIKDDKKEYLIRSFFKGMSIQALLVKKSIIEENNLKQVVGAVGQDTLFFYELLTNCSKVKAINLDIHIYYAAVEGSTVNSISKKYFSRAFKIEKAKYEFYKKNDLLEIYLNTRFEYYFKNWYMQKLKKVIKEDEIECIENVKEIFKLYTTIENTEDENIKEFIQLVDLKQYEEVRKKFL